MTEQILTDEERREKINKFIAEIEKELMVKGWKLVDSGDDRVNGWTLEKDSAQFEINFLMDAFVIWMSAKASIANMYADENQCDEGLMDVYIDEKSEITTVDQALSKIYEKLAWSLGTISGGYKIKLDIAYRAMHEGTPKVEDALKFINEQQ